VRFLHLLMATAAWFGSVTPERPSAYLASLLDGAPGSVGERLPVTTPALRLLLSDCCGSRLGQRLQPGWQTTREQPMSAAANEHS